MAHSLQARCLCQVLALAACSVSNGVLWSMAPKRDVLTRRSWEPYNPIDDDKDKVAWNMAFPWWGNFHKQVQSYIIFVTIISLGFINSFFPLVLSFNFHAIHLVYIFVPSRRAFLTLFLCIQDLDLQNGRARGTHSLGIRFMRRSREAHIFLDTARFMLIIGNSHHLKSTLSLASSSFGFRISS